MNFITRLFEKFENKKGVSSDFDTLFELLLANPLYSHKENMDKDEKELEKNFGIHILNIIEHVLQLNN